jgi:hypothetical protein
MQPRQKGAAPVIQWIKPTQADTAVMKFAILVHPTRIRVAAYPAMLLRPNIATARWKQLQANGKPLVLQSAILVQPLPIRVVHIPVATCTLIKSIVRRVKPWIQAE